MSTDAPPPADDARPPFMVELGLLPPYAPEDIEQAYRERVKAAHPDRGGSKAAFQALHAAYEMAKEYVAYRKSRRGWLAKQVDTYLVQQAAIDELRKLGTELEIDEIDWLRQSFGDFAEMLSQVVAVRLVDSAHGDSVIEQLVTAHDGLRGLRRLAFAGCQVSDAAVLRLRVFRELGELDLSNTPVTNRVLALAQSLTSLLAMNVDGTKVGWWTRRKIRALLKRRQKQKDAEHLRYLREEVQQA